jgi:hypothetical protein
MLSCYISDILNDDVIAKSFTSSWKVFPVKSYINDMTLINGYDPVIREVLINYLSHLSILSF